VIQAIEEKRYKLEVDSVGEKNKSKINKGK
jgi:hypothetical protein